MIVTDIVEMTKSRCRVFIDGSFAFVLYKGELRRYSVEKDKELAAKAYEELVTAVLPKRARLRSMKLLENKDYTEKQLRDKLTQGGYPPGAIEDAVSYVKSYHYIDDDRYATAFIEYHMENKSRQRIFQDLLKKGINKDCIEKQWEKLELMGIKGNEEEMIRTLLEKKHYFENSADIKEQRRIYAFLMRRGFTGDLVRKVMNAGLDAEIC